MATKLETNQDYAYISCLTYLAAEAERESNYVIAEILKTATANIYEWATTGEVYGLAESNELIDSFTAAFLFALRQRSLPEDKKKQMIALLQEIERGQLN